MQSNGQPKGGGSIQSRATQELRGPANLLLLKQTGKLAATKSPQQLKAIGGSQQSTNHAEGNNRTVISQPLKSQRVVSPIYGLADL